MGLILAQTVRTIASFLLLYGVLIAGSFLIAPKDRATDILDTSLAPNTVYATATKYLFFNRGTLSPPRPRVLILGSSDADLGMRPEQMQGNIPCAQVSNLAIGNSNATEIRQTVDLVHFVQRPEARLGNTFVFGVWYGVFGDSKDRWPASSRKNAETDIDLELYRYGFYRHTPEGPHSLLPPSWLPMEDALIRPFIVAEAVARQLTGKLRGEFFIRPPNRTEAEREAAHFSADERRAATAYWYAQLGRKDDISSDEFSEFENTIASLLDAHERVVGVDLPIPQWHQEAMAYDAKYHQRLPDLLKKFGGRQGFAFFNLSDLNADDDYSDEVHPKPHLAKIWAERIGKTVNSVACHSSEAASRQQPEED